MRTIITVFAIIGFTVGAYASVVVQKDKRVGMYDIIISTPSPMVNNVNTVSVMVESMNQIGANANQADDIRNQAEKLN